MQNNANDDIAKQIDVDVVQSVIAKVEDYLQAFVSSLPNLAAALVVLVLTWLLSKAVKAVFSKAMRSAGVRAALISLVRTVTGTGVWVLGILIAMAVVFPTIEAKQVITALGVGGVAIGFAFKDIFENFMAGAMIMLRKPMRIGDFVECQGVEGQIEDIMIRDTYLRKTDGQLVMMPNAVLFKNPVYIHTDNDLRRFDIVAGVSYDADVGTARKTIRQAVEAIDGVAGDKPVEVYAAAFNASSIDFTVRWWTDSKPLSMHQTRDAVIEGIKRALDDAGIGIPYPHRTLEFATPLQIAQRDASGDGADD